MNTDAIRTVITLHHCGAIPDPDTRNQYADLASAELVAIENRVELLERTFKHMHKMSENGDDCATCGLDLRDPIHTRLMGHVRKGA